RVKQVTPAVTPKWSQTQSKPPTIVVPDSSQELPADQSDPSQVVPTDDSNSTAKSKLQPPAPVVHAVSPKPAPPITVATPTPPVVTPNPPPVNPAPIAAPV